MSMFLMGALVLLVGVVGPSGRDVAVDAQPVVEPLFESVVLPYEGHGSIVVLNNGLLVVQVGGGTIVDENGSEWSSGWESFYFSPETEELTLVNVEGEGFLDTKGAMVQARGLSPFEYSTITFDHEAVANYASARESLLRVEGEMRLDFDTRSRVYHLCVRDSEGDKEFSVDFRSGSERLSADPTSIAPAPASRCTGSCTCSATCPNGTSCTITCSDYCCSCYCDGKPVCECRSAPPKDIVIIP